MLLNSKNNTHNEALNKAYRGRKNLRLSTKIVIYLGNFLRTFSVMHRWSIGVIVNGALRSL